MILVADSGSTKTDWLASSREGIDNHRVITTKGLNPAMMSEEQLASVISDEFLPQLSGDFLTTDDISIYFYGAGCRPDVTHKMYNVLNSFFKNSKTIQVASDMLGAARAVGKRHECIVAILGTGANSCHFDGNNIIRNNPSLGYILGDEGSGAVLGRNFLNALYEGALPYSMQVEFEKHFQLTLSDIIQKVYRTPMANRFLASMSPFIKLHIDNQHVETLVKDNFRQFFHRNIAKYQRMDLPIHCVGGLAKTYQEQLLDVARDEGFGIDTITDKPGTELLKYHMEVTYK